MDNLENQNSKTRQTLINLMPLCILLFVVLCISLSFIGPLFDVKVKIDGEEIYTAFKMSEILFGGKFSWSTTTFFILTYVVFPLLGCSFIFLGKMHKNFYVGAVLLFLIGIVNSIVVRDVAANALYLSTKLGYESHDIFFCYVLPIVAYIIAAMAALSIASKNVTISVVDLTEMGILISMAIVLNFVKFIQLGESGGSVNFQMLPLMILALRKGPLKGFIGAGIAYGLITCLTDGYGIATFPFDYLIGMGSVCILGFFQGLIFGENQKTYNFKGILFIIIGGLLATTLRFIGSSASSMIIYGYDIVPAMVYNVLYVFISGAISIAALIGLYGPFFKINERFPVSN